MTNEPKYLDILRSYDETLNAVNYLRTLGDKDLRRADFLFNAKREFQKEKEQDPVEADGVEKEFRELVSPEDERRIGQMVKGAFSELPVDEDRPDPNEKFYLAIEEVMGTTYNICKRIYAIAEAVQNKNQEGLEKVLSEIGTDLNPIIGPNSRGEYLRELAKIAHRNAKRKK